MLLFSSLAFLLSRCWSWVGMRAQTVVLGSTRVVRDLTGRPPGPEPHAKPVGLSPLVDVVVEALQQEPCDGPQVGRKFRVAVQDRTSDRDSSSPHLLPTARGSGAQITPDKQTDSHAQRARFISEQCESPHTATLTLEFNRGEVLLRGAESVEFTRSRECGLCRVRRTRIGRRGISSMLC